MAELNMWPCSARFYLLCLVAFFSIAVTSSTDPSRTNIGRINKCSQIMDASLSKRKVFLEGLQEQCKKHKASPLFCEKLQLVLAMATQSAKCNELLTTDVEPSSTVTPEESTERFQQIFGDVTTHQLMRNKRDLSSEESKMDDVTEGSGDGNVEEGSSRVGRGLKNKVNLEEDPLPEKPSAHVKKILIDKNYEDFKKLLDWVFGLEPCGANGSACDTGRNMGDWKDGVRSYLHWTLDHARGFFLNLNPSVKEAIQSSRSFNDLWLQGINAFQTWAVDTANTGASSLSGLNATLGRKINSWDADLDGALKWVVDKGSSYLEDSHESKEKWSNNLKVVVNWAMRKGKSFLEGPGYGSNGSAIIDTVLDSTANSLARFLPDSWADAALSDDDGEDGADTDVDTFEQRDGAVEARGKHKKKYLKYFAVVGAAKALLLKFFSIMAIKALTVKALVVSSIALTVAVIIAFKKLGYGGHGGGGHGKVVVTSHHTSSGEEGEHGGWDDAWESSSQGGPGPGVDVDHGGGGGWSSGGGGGGDGGGWSGGGGGSSGWQPSGGGWNGGGGGGGWNGGGGGGGWNGGGGGGWNGGGGGGGWGGGGGGGGGKGWNRAASSWRPGTYGVHAITADVGDLYRRSGQVEPNTEAYPTAR